MTYRELLVAVVDSLQEAFRHVAGLRNDLLQLGRGAEDARLRGLQHLSRMVDQGDCQLL